MTWFERRVVAFIQSRLGPNRVGPFGLLQPIADAIKLLFKESFVPSATSNKLLFSLAPMLAFITAVLSIAVIPIGSSLTIAGHRVELVISDLNIGILYIFALGSLGVYGVVLAGWSSNSKYSLRASAQMISYEIGLGLSVVGVLMLAQTFSLSQIVQLQSSSILNWYFFKQPVAFFLFLACAMAESNRLPFDLPEAESELVAGYHTEYAGMRFSVFFLGEYASHAGGIDGGGQPVFWRLGRTVSAAASVVFHKSRVFHVRLCLAEGNAAEIPLRPAHAVWLAGHIPPGRTQCHNNSRGHASVR